MKALNALQIGRWVGLGMAGLFGAVAVVMLVRGLLTGLLGAVVLLLAWLLVALLAQNFELRAALRQAEKIPEAGEK